MPTSDPQPSKLLPHLFKKATTSSPISPNQISVDVETIDTIKLYPNTSTRSPFTPHTYLPPMKSLSPTPEARQEAEAYEHALDFATNSWDLKTGGLKTLTAKRELPTRFDRRSGEVAQESRETLTSRNYMFAIIVLVCVVFMLIGGGVILFVILQP